MLQSFSIGDLTINSYDFFNYASIAVLVIWVITQSKAFIEICPHARRQQTKAKKWLVAALEFIVMTYAGVGLLLVLNPKFGDWFTQGNANYYGSLTAYFLAFMILSSVLKVSLPEALDLFTPGLPLSLVVSKIACVCHGCCSSFAMPGSFYFNLNTGRNEFPVQMLEAAVALALFIFMLWYRKRYRISGELFPLYVTIYSVTRFFTEFFRADLPKVLGPFNSYQIMSVIFAVIGIILLHIVRTEGDTIDKKSPKRGRNPNKKGSNSGKKAKGKAKKGHKK